MKAEQERAVEEAKVRFDTKWNTQATSVWDATNLKININCIARSEVERGGRETGSRRGGTNQGWTRACSRGGQGEFCCNQNFLWHQSASENIAKSTYIALRVQKLKEEAEKFAAEEAARINAEERLAKEAKVSFDTNKILLWHLSESQQILYQNILHCAFGSWRRRLRNWQLKKRHKSKNEQRKKHR